MLHHFCCQLCADVVRYRGQLYFVEDDQPIEPCVVHGSFIEFFLNGVSLGKAYQDIKEGTYHPAISMYSHTKQVTPVRVMVNFGDAPFEHPPKGNGNKEHGAESPKGKKPKHGNDVGFMQHNAAGELFALPVNEIPGRGLGDDDDDDDDE